MKILVTAFGPFGGRTQNASSLALLELKKRFPKLHTRLLPVDSVVAPARLKQAINHIRPDMLILLGEAAGSTTIRLETTSWNEIDFRIPDNAGRQPAARPIRRDAPDRYPSTLPLEEIHSALLQADCRVSISHDPGRYLCNQLFFIARHQIETESLACQAGFIHLPLEHDYPTAQVVDALTLIVDIASTAPGPGSRGKS